MASRLFHIYSTIADDPDKWCPTLGQARAHLLMTHGVLPEDVELDHNDSWSRDFTGRGMVILEMRRVTMNRTAVCALLNEQVLP